MAREAASVNSSNSKCQSLTSHHCNKPYLSRGLLFLIAIGTGLSAASIYYIQPCLYLVQQDFRISADYVAWVPMLIQAGCVLGMLLLVPLGDLMNRRTLILLKAGLLTLALIASAMAPSLTFLALAGIAIGLMSTISQDFLSATALLAPEEHRGRILGTVTTGLITGILLSRTLGGVIAEGFGWRFTEGVAACLILLVTLGVWLIFPSLPASTQQDNYWSLLGSMRTLWRRYPQLRCAIWTQALLTSSIGIFWSTLALMLAAPPFKLGADVAGAYGLAGAAGALTTPLFGGLADRAGPLPSIRIGCLLVAASFAWMWAIPHSLIALAVGAIVFDLGVVAALVSHQALVNSLDLHAYSRLNSLFTTGMLFGMTIGAGVGAWAWMHMGWSGICILGLLAGLGGLMISFFQPSTATIARGVPKDLQ